MKKEPCSRSGEMEFQESALGSRDNLLGAQRCGSRNLAPNSLTLSDSQTQLIHRYLDGECSYIARFFARRLLQTSSEARSYFNTLRDTAEKVCESTAMKAAALERESLSTEQMWARIQRRIEVEERASVLLGERNVVGTPSSVARMARERGTLGVVLDSLSEMFLGRRGSVFGGMAAITTCCVLVVMSISSPEVADKIMLQSGEGDIYPEGSELASESRLSFVESSNSAGSEITPRSEIRILPFSRSLPIDFVSARPNTFLQASPSRQGRHMQGDLPPWNATQMSFENHVSNSTEDYPLTSGTFDPFLFDDLLGQAYENNSSEAEVLWGSSLPPQIAVSGNYKGGRGTVGNDAVTRHDGGLERSTPSSVILREQIIPKTNFASR